ncbi:MAG: sigma-54-dependent Fis family transcriptional regulator [Leptospiraceae bacterium]|nr:sigma-54-dependent Fis family transcriptional regulator [Leptospiraceae bacterium]
MKTNSIDSLHSLVGNSTPLVALKEKIINLSNLDVPVYIQGEAGSGKRLIANLIAGEDSISIDSNSFLTDWNIIIRKYSQKISKNLNIRGERIKINIPLYFQNLEHLDSEGQSIIFRLLENQEYITPKRETIEFSSRLFFSSNKHLPQLVKDGIFRKDLFQKINLIRLNTPELKDIKSDIPFLVNHFVTEFKTKYKKNILRLSEKLIQFMLQYNWPGNVDQLRSMLEGMIILSSEKVLDITHVPKDFLSTSALTTGGKLNITPGVPLIEYEKEIIRENLKSTSGNREKCAKILGISERTLYRKIREYDLE